MAATLSTSTAPAIPSEQKSTLMANTKYRLKPDVAAKFPQSTSLVPVNLSERIGAKTAVVAVALIGTDISVDIAATATRPQYKRLTKGATQEQLKYLFEVEQNPNIEKVEE